ncbi:MAG: DUF6178 family protein [Acidobacteriota bacterium]|nr:DUF6178 family protein [Acidobacteriota bacterium]
MPAEHEEEVYTERVSRLAERGFPPLEESLEVWAPSLTAEQLARRLASLAPSPGSPRPAASTALVPVDSDPLPCLAQALAACDPSRAEAFIHQGLARLGNRFAVASLAHLGRPRTHRDGLRLAFCHANLGLELITRGDEARLGPALDHLSAAEVVGAGTAAVIERVERARRLEQGWLRRVHLAGERLDAPIARALAGLLRHRPRFEGWEESRPFRAVEDLERCDELLLAAESMGTFLEERLGAGARELPELARLPAGRRNIEDVEWSAVALTAIARRVLGGGGDPRPLSARQAAEALAALTVDQAGTLRCTPAFFAAAEQLGLAPAAPFLAARLEDSAQAARGQTPPNPDLLRALLLAPPGEPDLR